jgi:DNA-binding transcriptional LysR family regulator
VGEQFLDALDNGDCDLLLCYWHRDLPWGDRLSRERYQWINVAQELLVPVTVADESGQPRFNLPGTSAQPVPLIAYHPRGFLYSAIEAHLNRAKVCANLLPLNENTQSASIKDLVKQGFGMGWLPQRLTSRSEQFGSLTRAGDDSWNVCLDIRLVRLREPRTDDLLILWNTLESYYA